MVNVIIQVSRNTKRTQIKTNCVIDMKKDLFFKG